VGSGSCRHHQQQGTNPGGKVTASTTPAYGNTAIVVVGLAAGFVVVPVLAQANPELVNGFLVLILVGMVLIRSSQWLPLLTQFSTATSGAVAAAPGASGGTTASKAV
jgi:hypothetical protein